MFLNNTADDEKRPYHPLYLELSLSLPPFLPLFPAFLAVPFFLFSFLLTVFSGYFLRSDIMGLKGINIFKRLLTHTVNCFSKRSSKLTFLSAAYKSDLETLNIFILEIVLPCVFLSMASHWLVSHQRQTKADTSFI